MQPRSHAWIQREVSRWHDRTFAADEASPPDQKRSHNVILLSTLQRASRLGCSAASKNGLTSGVSLGRKIEFFFAHPVVGTSHTGIIVGSSFLLGYSLRLVSLTPFECSYLDSSPGLWPELLPLALVDKEL